MILAGGIGTRLTPLTRVTNKHLLPVYNEPMIYKVIKTLTNSSITDISIVLGGESVGDFIKLLGDGSEFGANFNYVYQQGPGGIAEALYLTKNIVKGHKVAVILGDNIFEQSFANEVREFENSEDYNCFLFLKEISEPQRFGVAELNIKGEIVNIEEKPLKPKSSLCVTGLYFYDKRIFDIIKKVIDEIGYSERGELEISDVNNIYIKMGKTKAHIIKGFWSDAGTFRTLLRCSNFIKDFESRNE
ncbi:MAG: sugar phosphate nucleotidyltransferase [Promethearchaeota archaeon]